MTISFAFYRKNAASPNHLFRHLLSSEIQGLRIRTGVELRAPKKKKKGICFTFVSQL
jgi:hypothetical protein